MLTGLIWAASLLLLGGCMYLYYSSKIDTLNESHREAVERAVRAASPEGCICKAQKLNYDRMQQRVGLLQRAEAGEEAAQRALYRAWRLESSRACCFSGGVVALKLRFLALWPQLESKGNASHWDKDLYPNYHATMK